MIALLLAFLLACSLSPRRAIAAAVENNNWKHSDMNPVRRGFIESYFDPSGKDCREEQCTFGLHYFVGEGFDARNSSRKNILYIPGGPGQIVNPRDPDLRFLEEKHNVVYFDVRGSGYSLIPSSKKYDRYLRAEYVVEDIEKIREHLKLKSWDAIYAHSWGTIVAHRYAEKSEELEKAGNERIVKKLILSAPVARGKEITEADRHAVIISNLKEIYEKYSSPLSSCGENLKRSEAKLIASQTNITDVIKESILGLNLQPAAFQESDGTDDLCFLTPQLVGGLLAKLTEKLNSLNEYGSLNLVTSRFASLAKDSQFRQDFPYQKGFFSALLKLQYFGGAEQPSAPPTAVSRLAKMRVARYLGYYLALPDAAWKHENHSFFSFTRQCDLGSPFLAGLRRFVGDSSNLERRFCTKINMDEFPLEDDGAHWSSVRARTLFGLHDGLYRWIFTALEKMNRPDADGCFHGKDIHDLTRAQLELHEIIIAEIRALQVNPSERICYWIPSRHVHGVTTLILKGKADPIIAGGQAESFFFEGLLGERTLIEFPGVGHFMQLADLQINGKRMNSGEAMSTIISEFLRESPEGVNFGVRVMHGRRDVELYKILAQLHAEIQTISVK